MIWNLLDAASEQAQPKGSPWPTFIIMGVFIIAIVAYTIWQSRSNKKKRKEEQEKVNALQVGDRVKTIGGICGFVAEINNAENTFVLRTGMEGNECFVKFDKLAIYQTAPAQGNVAPEEAKTEEVKAPEAAKAEVKEEVKAEVKTEVKADVKAEEKADK